MKPPPERRPRLKPSTPTVDDYFIAAHELAVAVRDVIDGKRVKRSKLERVLDRFEELDYISKT